MAQRVQPATANGLWSGWRQAKSFGQIRMQRVNRQKGGQENCRKQGTVLKEHIRRPTKGGFLCAIPVPYARRDISGGVICLCQANDLSPAAAK